MVSADSAPQVPARSMLFQPVITQADDGVVSGKAAGSVVVVARLRQLPEYLLPFGQIAADRQVAIARQALDDQVERHRRAVRTTQQPALLDDGTGIAACQFRRDARADR